MKHSLHGKRVSDLTTADWRRWRDSRVPTTDDREARRCAQTTANRVWTILRVSLNLAFQNERVPSDLAWRRLKPFKNVDRPQLSAEDCRRLIRSTPQTNATKNSSSRADFPADSLIDRVGPPGSPDTPARLRQS